MVVSAASREAPSLVYVVSRRPFSGSWEYMLDSAIFTYPPVFEWSGAPLISSKGELLGIGSLGVPAAAAAGRQMPGDKFAPVDPLNPFVDNLCAADRRGVPRCPWPGIKARERGATSS